MECDYLMEFLKGSHHEKSMNIYVRKNICGFIHKTPKVCCTSDDPRLRQSRKIEAKQPTSNLRVESPQWLKKLQRVFLSPPVCGSQLFEIEDKILGGNLTKVDEFPWTVPLFFSTRKLSLK